MNRQLGGFGGRGAGRGGGREEEEGRGLGGGMGGGRGGGPQAIIGFAVKGLASGIGLISEGVHSRKEAKNEKKRREANAGESSGRPTDRAVEEDEERNYVLSHEGDGGAEALEVGWALDDAQDDIPPAYSVLTPENARNQEPRSADQIVDAFLQNYMALPQSTQDVPLARLEYPVLLPQRRPKDRSRGFIRAYAPSLEPCGIDQEQWLAFLETFEKSSQANPWINAINLASIGAMFLPSVTGFIVSAAIQVTTSVAIEGHARYKTNTFLERVNKNYFQPRGLFCLLMTWNPESDDPSQSINMSTNVATAMNSRNKFKASSAKSYGETLFPEVAPLIFPGLDHLQNQTSEDALHHQNKLKKGKAFVDDYMDRRAVAKYAAKNPDSILATSVPAPKFTSRYADPAHPASSGDLVALVTGGKLSAGGLKGRGGGSGSGSGGGRGGGLGGGLGGLVGGLGRGRSMGGGGQDGRSGSGGGMGRGAGTGGGSGGIGGTGGGLNIKKYLKKNVLYLLVVNMPSEEEMADARRHASR